MTDLPTCARYRVPSTEIDGPVLAPPALVEVRLWCRVGLKDGHERLLVVEAFTMIPAIGVEKVVPNGRE